MKRTLVLLASLGAVACGMSEDKYAAKAAELACANADECGYLDSFGGTIEDCEAFVEEAVNTEVTSEDCTYDGGAARKCIKEMKAASGDCEWTPDADSACNDVCGAGGDTGV